MAGYVLHLSEQENITLSAAVTRRLLDGGDGDAALLYLCLLKNRGSASPETLCAELKWDAARRSRAEAALARMGLVSTPPAPAPAALKPDERPAYTRDDVARKLENDNGFAALLREVERKLGPLSSPSVGKLLGLYEDLGLPADVIFLLVNHCIESHAEQYGEGRLPTMRRIEQEGYAWARHGLLSTAAANEYLKTLRERRQKYPAYMAVLQLGERRLSPSEEKYLAAWMEMGFPAETVALAYDKTVLRCHEFKWSYCNGILKRWHEKGLHTPEETAAETAAPKPDERSAGGRNDWMKQYL